MSGFTKLFASITESSIWCANDKTLRVWIAMLARSDAHGHVEGSIPGFASLCRISISEMQEALQTLTAPDEFSRSSAEEGRRIVPISGGWRIVNYLNYRDRTQSKAGSTAAKIREWRLRRQNESHDGGLQTVTCNQEQSHVRQEAEAEAEAEEQTQTPPAVVRVPEGFEEFWKAYPRKVAKPQAIKAWRKLNPNQELRKTLLTDVKARSTSLAWTKDNGNYIPHPATYLNNNRWEDSAPAPAANPVTVTDLETLYKQAKFRVETHPCHHTFGYKREELPQHLWDAYDQLKAKAADLKAQYDAMPKSAFQ